MSTASRFLKTEKYMKNTVDMQIHVIYNYTYDLYYNVQQIECENDKTYMNLICLACNERYFYRDGDEDCSEFVCSHCFGGNLERLNLSNWARLRFRILNRDEMKCKYCGNSPLKDNTCILNVDHIIPLSKGGTNSEKNLITACGLCNMGKLSFDLKVETKKHIDEYINNEKTIERLENGRNKNIKE